ncbi:MAG: HPr family phosphocarrier protein [Eubacteriales bacterium]|nr:HPr family phosphocarrier protein [Eubacteriales bacterium]
MLNKSIVINRPQGLEARPIAELVQVASKYESRVYLKHGVKKVNAKSIMGMMSLQASVGESVEVMIDGVDEESAMTEITAFLCAGSVGAAARGAFAAV